MLKKYATLYGHFFLQNLKTKLEYRLDFLLGMAGTVLIQLTGIATIGIIFSKITHIRGWGLYEVALIFGLAGAGRGICEFFFDNVWYLSWVYIREGRLDHILHRPVAPLFHIIADKVETHGLGNFATGLLIALIAWHRLGIAFTPGRVGFLILAIICGSLLHFAINLAFASISFWLIDMRNLMGTIDQFGFLGKYPITIYPQFLQVLITWLLPYAFVAFFPAAVILHKSQYLMLGCLAPAVTLLFLFGAIRFFGFSLKRYESTGT